MSTCCQHVQREQPHSSGKGPDFLGLHCTATTATRVKPHSSSPKHKMQDWGNPVAQARRSAAEAQQWSTPLTATPDPVRSWALQNCSSTRVTASLSSYTCSSALPPCPTCTAGPTNTAGPSCTVPAAMLWASPSRRQPLPATRRRQRAMEMATAASRSAAAAAPASSQPLTLGRCCRGGSCACSWCHGRQPSSAARELLPLARGVSLTTATSCCVAAALTAPSNSPTSRSANKSLTPAAVPAGRPSCCHVTVMLVGPASPVLSSTTARPPPASGAA